MESQLADTLKSGHLQYCAHFILSQMYLHMFVYNLNAETPTICKADRFPSPDSAWTVQNLLNNLTLVYRFRKFVRCIW